MKLDEDNITKLIAFGPFLFVPLFILIIVVFVLKVNKTNFEQTVQRVEKDLISNKNQAMKSKINGITDLVYYQNSVIEKNLQRKLKTESSRLTKLLQNFMKPTKKKKQLKKYNL